MMEWPDGKRVAVSFAFDVDLELNWSESNRLDPGHLVHMSKGTYGAKQGIPRILNMLDIQGIQATFFVPAYNATVYPEVIREIHRRGHEIANHGLHHFDSMGDDPKLVFEEAERILYGRATWKSWRNQAYYLIGKKTDYSLFAKTDMHLWYGIKGSVDKKLSKNLGTLKASGYPFAVKIFTDLGHGSLAGEHPEQFVQEVSAAHGKSLAGKGEEK